MIISFSGLGGSGKTTHIRELATELKKNHQIKVIALREYFWWPKIVNFLRSRKNTNKTSSKSMQGGVENWQGNTENVEQKKSGAYYFFRDIFYILDCLRLRVFLLISNLASFNSRAKIIIFDRAIDDFAIELNTSSPFYLLHKFFVWIFPKSNIHFFLESSPETVFARKKEESLERLKFRQSKYEKFFTNKNCVRISTEGDGKLVGQTIITLVEDALSCKGQFSIEGLALYDLFLNNFVDGAPETFLNGPIIFEPKKLWQTSIRNRIAFHFLETIKDNEKLLKKYWQEDWQKYYDYALKQIEKKNKTINFLMENLSGINFSLIKNDEKNIDISSDVDLLFLDKKDFEKAIEIFEKKGKVTKQTNEKHDISIDGYLPIDLHLGLNYGYYKYIQTNSFPNLSQGAQTLLSISGHAVSELTMVTLGDIVKTAEAIDVKTLKEARTEAKILGWERGLGNWLLFVLSPEEFGFNFPKNLSMTSLFISRIKMSLKQKSFRNLPKEIILLARAIRARSLGKVPFHEHWTENI